MRVWDIELLKTKNISMVTDGLILWIDGRDAPLANKSVVNRVTGKEIESTGASSWNVAKSTDGLYTTLSSTTQSNFRLVDPLNKYTNAGTIEVVRKIGTDDLRCGVFDTSSLYGRIKIMNTSIAYSTSAGYENSIPLSSPAQHVVAKPGFVFTDGQKNTTSSSYNSVSFSEVILLCRCYGQLKTMNVGAIRVYDRELTDDEIAQNLEYEKSIGRVII